MSKLDPKQAFEKLVGLKYELYNGLFLTLPFPNLKEVGIKLPIFAEWCNQSLGRNPLTIIDSFFVDKVSNDSFEKKMDILFLFSQFIERQVVLFDALEQAAFSQTHALTESGSIDYLLKRCQERSVERRIESILKNARTRVALTAHPTQFYPETVLGIIDQFAEALKKDDLTAIEEILLQLGMTSFRNPEAPTPLSEAENLLSRTHKIFYQAIMELEMTFDDSLPHVRPGYPIIELSFWPGGDRDGNPLVDVKTTLNVAKKLKETALAHYLDEINSLRQKLTFPGMQEALAEIEKKLSVYQTSEELLDDIKQLKKRDEEYFNSLFIKHIESLERAVKTFGFHFASIDLRQDSSIHEEVAAKLLTQFAKENKWPENSLCYSELSSEDKIELLEVICTKNIPLKQTLDSDDILTKDVLGSLKAMDTIQAKNGSKGMERVIISNTQGPEDLLEILFFHSIINNQSCSFDIIPLFETIKDLKNSCLVMKRLFSSKVYQNHLKKRNGRQVVMLGFSDGTKDGGYLTCNWNIFKAKKELAQLAKESGVEIVFFDGRGGPPARGGGNTHKFYQAIGALIDQTEVQLTLQGQTISSKFGNLESALYNLGQIVTAGIEPRLFPENGTSFSQEEITLLDTLSKLSYDSYMALRENPLFIPFLQKKTPLEYYAKLNVASRPAKRGRTKELELSDLRAIPFVGAWSQIKLNVPGFYGLGTALKKIWESGYETHIKTLYRDNLFFSTLIDNAMQALAKSNIHFTTYLLQDKTFGPFVKQIHDEAKLTTKYILAISDQKRLMDKDPLSQKSIALRDTLIMPLVIIQQWALTELEKPLESRKQKTIEKLLLKTLPPIINAARNSA